MPLILSQKDLESLDKKTRVKKGRPVKPSKKAERELLKQMNDLWQKVLFPATERIKQLLSQGASPLTVAEELEQMLRTANASYAMMSRSILDKWKLSMDQETRAALNKSLKLSLGVDISATLDTPVIMAELNGVLRPFSSAASAEASGAVNIRTLSIDETLGIGGLEAANLIKTIPGEYLGRVAQAVGDNFAGRPLPEGRSLLQQVQHLGGVSYRRAKLISRDQTSKMTGLLQATRQQSIGIEEYIWRTSRDQRVVGNPMGLSPTGNSKHMDHFHREGKKFRWDDPPPDGPPGYAIQCRCRAEPIIDPKRIAELARVA